MTGRTDYKVRNSDIACPSCGSCEMEGPRADGDAWNQHFKCVCGLVLFANAESDTPTRPLNYCGNPKGHWQA